MAQPRRLGHPGPLAGLLTLAALAAPATAQHLHVQISFAAPREWRLFLLDFDSGEFDPRSTPITIPAGAFHFVPTNDTSGLLGQAGAPAWTLPEMERPELPHLGLGTSGISASLFSPAQVRLELHEFSGPGSFTMFSIDPFGTPIVHLSSRDGVHPAADGITLSSVGGHVHVNWSFSAPGTYTLGFAASGRSAATGQRLESAVVPFTFVVEDVPWRPRLTLARQPGAPQLDLVIEGEAGRRCRIEASPDGVHWSAITNLVLTNPITRVPWPVPTEASTLFRALVPPP